MRLKKTAPNIIQMSTQRSAGDKYEFSRRDAIRMKFLEQSARYLGVYVDNSAIKKLDGYSVS